MTNTVAAPPHAASLPAAAPAAAPQPARVAAPLAPRPVAPSTPRPVPAVIPAAPAAASPAAEPPPTEQFRRDLVAAVAERTGYPVDMLKEDALLEADLGIDSIKTVEIFGSLTDYHRFMPGGGGLDEELLGEFATLKTLGDIIAMYDRGRSGNVPRGTATAPAAPLPTAEGPGSDGNPGGTGNAGGTGAAPRLNSHAHAPTPTHATNGAAHGAGPVTNGSAHRPAHGSGNEAAPTAQALERLEVRAEPAPFDTGREKKNSPLTTSS